MRKTFLCWLLLFLVTVHMLSRTALHLTEVVITANKYPNKTSLTGKVVTIITKEQLEKMVEKICRRY